MLDKLPGELVSRIAKHYLDMEALLALSLTCKWALRFALGDPHTVRHVQLSMGLVWCAACGLEGPVAHIVNNCEPTAEDMMNGAICAAEHGHTGLLDLLWLSLAYTPHVGDALLRAARNGHSDTVDFILSRESLETIPPASAIAMSAATEAGDLVAVQTMHNIWNTPEACVFYLKNAVVVGHIGIVLLMVEALRGEIPLTGCVLYWAFTCNHHKLAKALAAHPRMDPGPSYNYVLQLCAFNNHVDLLEVLLSHDDAKPQSVNVIFLVYATPEVPPERRKRNYALRVAADRGHAEVVRLLLADQRVRDAGVPPEILERYSQ